jgi:hypothetical protein
MIRAVLHYDRQHKPVVSAPDLPYAGPGKTDSRNENSKGGASRSAGIFPEANAMFSLHRSRVTIPLAAFVAAASLSARSEAQVSPASYYMLATNEPASSTGSSVNAPGMVSGTGCSPGDASECQQSFGSVGSAPFLEANGFSTSGASGYAPQASSGGSIYYYFEVLNSASATPAPVQLTFSGEIAAQGTGSGAAGGTINFGGAVHTVCGGAGCAAGTPSALTFSNYAFTVMSNTQNLVLLEGNGYTQGELIVGVPSDTPGTYSIDIDPSIAISASQPNIADYSLIFSAGIQNTTTPVPLSGSLIMVLSGVACFVLLPRTRRRSVLAS